MYYLTDNLGSTRALTNATGAVVRRYDYTPYGQAQATGGSSDNPYQYTGRELDKSGLQYYRARYYSPEMGRFISEDSYGFASGDANFYAYALGNPVSFNDPSGHIAWVAVPVIWAGIEFAVSVYDAYDTGKTLLDPCATTGQKITAASLFVVGVGLPGGGYGAASRAAAPRIWTSTAQRSHVRNAFEHWNAHRTEFPEFQNARQYVEGTRDFFANPPPGTLTKTRPNGDVLQYNPATNTFGVQTADGVPRTMFRPKQGMIYWNKQ
nr:RHS repeat-associated core domain-containing protein [Xanthomonas cannabis]